MHSWKDRAGSVELRAVVRVKSTGWSDEGYIGGPPEDCREPSGEETREIVSVEVGGRSVSARRGPELFLALVGLLREDVDGASEDDFSWEGDE